MSYDFILYIPHDLITLVSLEKHQNTEAFVIKSSFKNIFFARIPPAFALKFVSHTAHKIIINGKHTKITQW